MQKPIKKVHVVFKTHLDVGFTNSSANVINAYMTRYIPGALALAKELRNRDGAERFIWTTGSWLIYEFLEQAKQTERKQMEDAILAGDIVWHALPFTTHTEIMDPSLFRFGLSLSRALDKRFGRTTIAAKMTDVPGHSRSMLPFLVEAGVQFLHLGVNPASRCPDVPPLFVWQGPAGAEVIVMYGKGGYGETAALPEFDELLAFAHTGDNCGPPPPEKLVEQFNHIREKNPGSEVVASTLDAYAVQLRRYHHLLPIITNEIGDTWIHGVGTDPLKVAQFRALCRLRNEWEKSGIVTHDNPEYAAFSRSLLMVPEHTWGKDEKVHLPAKDKPDSIPFKKDETYNAHDFAAARKTSMFKKFEESWAEQRAYITTAVAALGNSDLAVQARQELNALFPVASDKKSFQEAPVKGIGTLVPVGGHDVAIDERGALLQCIRRSDNRSIASVINPLGLFTYQTFSEDNYTRYLNTYNINMEYRWCNEWAVADFSKPGIGKAGAIAQSVHGKCVWAGTKQGSVTDTLAIELHLPNDACTLFGAPRCVFIEYLFPKDTGTIEVTLSWFDKSACRMPEALWLTFAPLVGNPNMWMMEKMGSPVSPLDVVRDGNRNLHAVTGAIWVEDSDERIAINSLDAVLVAPGTPRLLEFTNEQPDLHRGMHYNLYNNIWGTNFPMWYEENAKFRFALTAR